MAKKKGLIWAIVAVVAVAAIFTGIYLANRPATQEGAKTITFVINGKDASRSVEIHTDREYLGEALTDEKLVEGTESEYGLFVTKVDGIEADSANQGKDEIAQVIHDRQRIAVRRERRDNKNRQHEKHAGEDGIEPLGFGFKRFLQ